MSQVAGVTTGQVAETRQSNTFTPAMLLQMAVEKGADIDRLQQLMELRDRWEAGEARKAFVDAMADLKTQPIHIVKGTNVNYESSKGTVNYWHADLSAVCEALVPALARVGISHRWDVKQEDGQIIVTCILTHRMGHSESLTLRGPKDDSGSKNNLQAVSSTITYLERYSLLSITGTATKGMDDDDGRSAVDPDAAAKAEPMLDVADVVAIAELCKAIGPNQLKAILGAYKVQALDQIPKRFYASIVERLNAKRARAAS